jgi:hypothetical protein
VFSEHAEAIELCLFDAAGGERKLRLFGPSEGIFHGFLPGAQPWPTVRLARARSLPSGGRPAVQSGQAAAGSVGARNRWRLQA